MSGMSEVAVSGNAYLVQGRQKRLAMTFALVMATRHNTGGGHRSGHCCLPQDILKHIMISVFSQ
ncbi:hypothetical protein E2C01_083835 [Portunus trituberculatus]|uniref:Uncharacterized protein n=1 Tax=Portunus trituberculatus TaxID=210409 RepID=A0A5B7ITJ4_PORTR|nr:hypothetical protein [Portunus trituberculatus]